MMPRRTTRKLQADPAPVHRLGEPGEGPEEEIPASEPPLLFAYGSNLYPPRLRARTPSARYLEPAVLPGHALRFHKRGSDGSAKADAHATGSEADVVWGVLYTLDRTDKLTLDTIEGPGYHETLVRVETRDGTAAAALMYQARPDWRVGDLRPYRWYRDYILIGARHHGFPTAYLRSIRAVRTIRDPNPERRHTAERILASRVGRGDADHPNRT